MKLRNKIKSFVAMTMSAAMLLGQGMPVLASGDTASTTPSSNAASGNILAYANEKVVVPTKIELSFNPDGYDVVTRFNEDGTPSVSTNDQIVSLGYGIASEATTKKTVTVTFETSDLTQQVEGRPTKIQFVDSEAEVDKATLSECKVYLAIATSSDAPKTANGEDFAVDPTTHKSNASANTLSDVSMNKTTSANYVAFGVTGDNTSASVNFAVSLNKAKYTVSAGQTISFNTTQQDLKNKLNLNTLGGTAAFTFVGKMNANGDWSKAALEYVQITPTYKVTTQDKEVTIVTGTYAQISGDYLSVKTMTATNNTATLKMPAGVTVSKVELFETGKTTDGFALGAKHYTISESTLTVTASEISGWVPKGYTKIVVTFSDNHAETITLQ